MKRGLTCLLIPCLLPFISSCNSGDEEVSCGNIVSSYVGVWNITEQCAGNEFGYPITITQKSASEITLQNLGDGGPNSVVNATLNGNSGFNIYLQTVQGLALTGNGSLNGGCIQLVLEWSGWKGECTAAGTK